MLTSKTRRKRERMFLVVCFFLANVIRVNALNDDNARVIKLHDYPIVESHESNPTRSTEKSIFTYQRAGVRVDIKIVSLPRKNSTGEERKIVESFPEFPARDIGRCVLDLSLICVKKRFAKLLESIARLDEIALIGQDVKLVKTRVPRYERRSITGNDVDDIERSIDDFFDTFVLRITLPRWNGKRERNQIDVMFDESGPMEVFEGRGRKGGGGGGGLGGNKGGGGGGGKCKMMMMAMLMLAKMKIIGVIGMMAMKGMIMGAMSLMISTVMLMMKFLKGGGPWQSGGGGGGGGGSQIKEVVLLAKIPNGGGGGGYGGNGNGGGGGGGNGGYGGNGNGYGNGGCCNGNGGDSYSPPSPSYGVPSGGGGGGGYGGGWGRSFSSRVVLPHLEASRNNKSMVRNKIPLMIGESIDNRASPNYEDYQDSNVNLTSSRVDLKSLNYTMSPNYRNINGSINTNSTELLNSTSVDTNGKLERAESFYDLNVLRPVYINEWQAVENANAFNEKANQE